MIHIEQIKILDNYRNLKKKTVINLKQITYLVGEQGCGKSSLLSLLQLNDNKVIQLKLSDFVLKNGVESFYFDTEKMNPRICSVNDYTTPSGMSKGIGIGNALKSHFTSHGETLRKFTVDIIHRSKDAVVLLDEPECALSLRNQFKLANEIIKTSENNNVQFIIATHCLPLIESVQEVYSLEHNKWIESKEFINLNKNIINEK